MALNQGLVYIISQLLKKRIEYFIHVEISHKYDKDMLQKGIIRKVLGEKQKSVQQ